MSTEFSKIKTDPESSKTQSESETRDENLNEDQRDPIQFIDEVTDEGNRHKNKHCSVLTLVLGTILTRISVELK